SLFIPNLLLRWGMLTRRFPRCQSIRASGRRGSLASEPVEDLLAGPMHDARFAQHVPIQSLKIADAVRDARDVGMYAYCHDSARAPAFLVQAIEVIAAATQHLLGRVLLHDHHHNVVYLHRIGHRDQWAMRGR